jgi:AcrR family transcriptional regulator
MKALKAKPREMPVNETRERILEAALALFRERGFAEATMRDIAARAGVATGLAYYYFESKNAIVLAFYDRATHELPARLVQAHTHRTLPARLEAIVLAKFDYFMPNRRFLAALMAHAADPSSPLSPFSEASTAIRTFDIAQFDRALTDTHTAMPRDLAPHMAKILWLYQLGMLLFWFYDRSPGQKRSRELLDASLKIVVALIRLSNIPLLKPARRSVLNIVHILER